MYLATEFKEVQQIHKTGPREIARKIALDVLGKKTQLFPNESLQRQPRVQFIYIHHIFKDEERMFKELLLHLARQFTFISYGEAVKMVLKGTADKPYMAFSSDDGFANNMAAARILEEFGATACFFLNPGTIGMQDPNQILRHCRQRLNFPPVEFLNWNQVNELQKNGHEIGSHTMWHAKLSDLGITEIQEDLVSSKEILEQKCGPIEHFAYPYGRWFHFSKEALDATWAAGYKSCASAERGCHLPTEGIDEQELVIRRDHILANWPISHVDYFMENNVRQFNPTLNPWK